MQRTLAVVTLAVGAALLLCSCSSDAALSTAQIEAVPDSHLVYPGSRTVRVDAVAQEAAQINASAVDGFVATTLRSQSLSSAVLAWYKTTLRSHGWAYRSREPHGDVYDGHPVPPAYLFTRGRQEVFSLTFDPTAGDYITTYIALIGHCDTTPPYPLAAGNCSDGRPE